MTPVILLASLVRRASLLLHSHAGRAFTVDTRALRPPPAFVDDQRRLQWRDWRRFSARQGREMTLGGLLGQWVIEGELDEVMPWLWLGQFVHAGKNATFGLGQMVLSAIH
jgi:hypothetical protein